MYIYYQNECVCACVCVFLILPERNAMQWYESLNAAFSFLICYIIYFRLSKCSGYINMKIFACKKI